VNKENKVKVRFIKFNFKPSYSPSEVYVVPYSHIENQLHWKKIEIHKLTHAIQSFSY
jgi:hypothetical protein